ncbi:ParA family protein [Halosegnis marinus]|uniref:ParA family protein n=1 Tax=Halosegnis marinus TaxID=3034023 RepID=A0ABD5ZPG3_9EURY|nr:ParA family protein [Halosegnis sp. DT85]
MSTNVTSLVGAVGGAGTTRLCIELAGLFAAEGDRAVVLDAAYATQGLADHMDGRIDPDATALVTADRPLADGLVGLDTAGDGTVEALPARASFERLARAKTPEAARRFESLLAEAREHADRVLVDVPPVAANQAVAAVNAADRVALVAPGTTRGADGVARLRDRLADIGTEADAVVATRAVECDFADACVPADDAEPGETPVADTADGAFAAGVAAAAEVACDAEIERSFDGGLLPL